LPQLLADPATRAAATRYAEPTADLAIDPDAEVRRTLAKHPALPMSMRDLLAQDSDMFVRDAIAARPDTPQDLRDTLIAGLTTDDPEAELPLAFTRAHHTCPFPAPTPEPCTREQAEELLGRAGL
jgi:hypothetical protein